VITVEAPEQIDLPNGARSEEPTRSVSAVARLDPSWARSAATIVIVSLMGLTLWFLLHALVLSGLEEQGSQARLYAKFRSQLAQATAPLGGAITTGSPVALLTAPSAGLRDAVVVEGTTSVDLAAGPGHLADTPLPGQAGVSVIFGRSVTYGAPFRHIPGLKQGSRLTLTTGQGVFTYGVDRIRRAGSPLPPSTGANQSRLTLVTSAAGGWRTGWAPSGTVYIDASLIGSQVQPAPSGRPTAVGRASLPMQGDSGTLVSLVFWLEAALLVAVGTGWVWSRWGHRQLWVVGLPILLAVLWGATGAAEKLLPNLV
jgi:sortase A